MTVIPETLARNAVLAWGDEGRVFLDSLPELVDEVTRDWGLTLGEPFPMTFHWVCRVHRADGSPAVVKLGPAGSRHLPCEAAALRHYDGHGAVRLLEVDEERGALLLEQAEPGTAASSVTPHRDIVATAAIITVMHRLHKPAPAGIALPDLLARDQESFVDHLRRHPGDAPLPRRLVTRAMGLAAELTADVVTPVVLHGDLHHDNVLRGTREPWLAIDPHGAVGDPIAEVGAMLYNPDPPRRDRSLLDLVPSRIEQLADGLGVPQERVVAWGFVHAVLSEVWTAENPDEPVTRALDVALLLEPRLS